MSDPSYALTLRYAVFFVGLLSGVLIGDGILLTAMKRIKSSKIRHNTYAIIRDALEEGVMYALKRADKHREKPLVPDSEKEQLADEIVTHQLTALSERINFDK